MTTWHANVAFTTDSTFTHDAAFDVLDKLSEHAAAVAPRVDATGGDISFTIEAATITAAINTAITTITNTVTSIASRPTIDAIEITTETELDKRLAEPVFPEVIGFAEIAELAGVSRQRARQFATIDGFPAPVITTAQGPLMTKAAVERWIENRNTRPGRPKAAVSA
ncbi:hypothetical protein [Brevibacterium gallinarum]|uniref:DNA-binding protein n=1 Tax=Brevibacterium gallinarum TaxID=2762220 RepID=A0ABR8WQR2_9MICO|nr:hypothetical protein [Brevibacterium gallinarum]MBD8019403.1 hypothetical protein [Brevibacterium gallinarum]